MLSDWESECVRFTDELKCGWSPAAQTLPTDADRVAISAMNESRFEHHRVGYNHKPMVFRGNGTFVAGSAGYKQ